MKKTLQSSFTKFTVALSILLLTYLPTIRWMIDRWLEKESYYGHGFLIPLVSLFIIWQRKEILKKIKPAEDMMGLWVVIGCVIINTLCAALKVYFISGFSLVAAIIGLVLFIYGKEMVKNLVFPLLFLLAMVPLPLVLIGNLTVQMKLFATQVSVFILNRVGFPSIQDGSVIRMPGSYISIEAPCSGLRSLISLLTLGLLFAYALKVSFIKKAVLFIASAPIAIATNVLRILLIAIVNDLYGSKVAMGFFHDMTGYLVFAVAFGLLYGLSKALEGRVNA